ncbi:MAG: response regulator transcription factor [Bryobacteraceae bacterium]|nr:response regulator transcription factor [Bryobacteraceae bacterium]
MIRLILVEDESLVRLGMRQLLGFDPRIEVIADASSGTEALVLIDHERPDVVLMDVRLPGMSGIEVLKALRDRQIAVPVILITTFDDEHAFLQAMHAGASGFLRKDISLEELTAAIDCAIRGERIFRPAITQIAQRRLFEMKSRFAAAELPDPLTKREVEVLRLMAAGLSNKEIGDALTAGEATIKTHVSSILSKLGVRDRTRAVLKGLELGYV